MSGYRDAEGRVGDLTLEERMAGEPYADVRVRYLYEIGELYVEDGDIVVVFSEQRLDAKTAQRLSAELERVLPPGTPVLILDMGLKLGVLHGNPELRHGDLFRGTDGGETGS